MKLIKSIMFVVTMFVFAGLVGCATPANYQNMIVRENSEVKKNPKLKNSIIVENIAGGKKTNPLWLSKVDNQTFKQALEGSLEEIGYGIIGSRNLN